RGVEGDRRHAGGQRGHRSQAAALGVPGDGEVGGVAVRVHGAEAALELDRGAGGQAAELVDLVAGGEAGALAEVVHPVGAAAVGAAVGEHEVAVAVPVDLGLEVLRDQLVAAVEVLRAPSGGVVDAGGGEIGVGDRAPAGRGRR